ncbi:MAG: EF-P beta-lysylation protein EpmB [Candidatus Thiodiazotropha sp. (ex Monitilora ramsayi)]|nr:EF-P beta-lysylation protein EpmB [Candidatus Thiodiazotropha sp. (ex Monitilora ramsayi)]
MSSSRNRSIAAHIIPECDATLQTPPWQQALSQAFTDLPSLLSYLQLSDIDMADAQSAIERFGLRVPREFAALMRPGDPEDPLLKQVLPLADELASQPGYTDNPVGDREAEVHPGLLHKYHGRALVIATGACAVNCRYCFRRHYPYENGSATPRQWERILDYLHREKTIDEVILSGGDPLMMSDEKLEAWLTKLSTIPHLKRVRLHTRLPVVLPQRINQALVESLTRIRLQTMMVIHVNHPNEISPQVAEGMAALKDKNITLLNQSVLLKGVNDDAETLISVSERLFSIGVLPYYLHLLDRVAGAAHFDVEWRSAQRLYKELQAGLPGYLVPKMVREIAGEKSKTLVQALTE